MTLGTVVPPHPGSVMAVSSVPFSGASWDAVMHLGTFLELKPGGGQVCPASALALPSCGVPGRLLKNCLELCGIK